MKRPERSLYTPPALRSKFNKECAEKIDNIKDQYGTEAESSQTYSLGKTEISQRRSTNIVPRRVRFDSSGSSSNSRIKSDEFCKDDDSKDFEGCSSGLVPINDLKISKETNKDNSNYHWEGGGRGKPAKNEYGVEIENCQTDIKISNRILMQHKDNSGIKSHSNHCGNSASIEAKLYSGLFDNYGDSSISDIETVIDSYTRKGSVLTSTPNSDIVDEKVIDAAKYVSEESGMESTLLGQNEVHESTINTNRNTCDYNFEIYRDPPLVKNQPIDYSEIFGNNYIPPPDPPPATPFILPPVHRLPFPVSSPYKLSVPHPVYPQQLRQPLTQLRHTRHVFPQSPQQYPIIPRLPFRSSHTPSKPRHLLSSCLQPGSPPNASRMPSYIPPPHLPTLESHKQNDSFFIPPPRTPQMIYRNQQIYNLNQRQDEQNCPLNSKSLINGFAYDHKIWPQSPK